MRSLLSRLARDERGGEAIDYVLVLGLIVIGCLLLMGALGIKVQDRWKAVVNALT